MIRRILFGHSTAAFRAAVISVAGFLWLAGAATANLWARPAAPMGASPAKRDQSTDHLQTKLKIRVLGNNGEPVGNASVYVRFNVNGGNFLHHHEKLAELDLKTNQDGSVKVPPIPQGKIMIQVIAKGWHTFGKWYDVEKERQSIEITLEPPPHWY